MLVFAGDLIEIVFTTGYTEGSSHQEGEGMKSRIALFWPEFEFSIDYFDWKTYRLSLTNCQIGTYVRSWKTAVIHGANATHGACCMALECS